VKESADIGIRMIPANRIKVEEKAGDHQIAMKSDLMNATATLVRFNIDPR
jgi:hypothetical protein